MPVHIIYDLPGLYCHLLVTHPEITAAFQTEVVKVFVCRSSGAECQTDEQRTETRVGGWD